MQAVERGGLVIQGIDDQHTHTQVAADGNAPLNGILQQRCSQSAALFITVPYFLLTSSRAAISPPEWSCVAALFGHEARFGPLRPVATVRYGEA